MKTLQTRLEALEASLLRPARRADPLAKATLLSRLDSYRARVSGEFNPAGASIMELVAHGHNEAAMSQATAILGESKAVVVTCLIAEYASHQRKDTL